MRLPWRDKDQCALRRARTDPEAFVEVYDQMSPSLLRHFARKTGDAHLALELTAETLAKAYEARRSFRGEHDAQAAAWIWAIARTELAMFWRNRAVNTAAMQRLGLPPVDPSEDELTRINDLLALEGSRPHLDAALSALPADQRKVVELHIVDELTYAEIADQLQITNDLVRARASRGLRALGAHPALTAWREARDETPN